MSLIKGIGFFLGFCILTLQYRLWLGDGSIREVFHLSQEVQIQERVVAELEQRNRLLEAEVQDLKQRLGALEERARTDLGMIREGETFYQLAEPKGK